MSCDSGSDSDLSCFGITHFSDHYDVRVLTEDRTKRSTEGHTCFFVYLTLVDISDLLLDRVFDRDNVKVWLSDLTERRIKSCRFTGTGRSCYKHHALRHFKAGYESFIVIVGHTEILDPSYRVITCEDTDNDLFAINHWKIRYTKVDSCSVNDL